jgi:hypothetical protein
MDVRNRSIPVGSVTSFDVNKAIQRSLTKAVARHGLGLYIYAGEDLPEEEAEAEQAAKAQKRAAPVPVTVTRREVYDPRPLIARIKAKYQVDDDGFARMRMTLLECGAIPDKAGRDMTEADWVAFEAAAYATFGDVA